MDKWPHLPTVTWLACLLTPLTFLNKCPFRIHGFPSRLGCTNKLTLLIHCSFTPQLRSLALCQMLQWVCGRGQMSRVLPSGACVLEHRTGQHTWKTNTVAAGRSERPWVRSGGLGSWWAGLILCLGCSTQVGSGSRKGSRKVMSKGTTRFLYYEMCIDF